MVIRGHSVDVIVPVLNGGERFAVAAAALVRQTAPCRVIVVDNGSSDGSRAVATEHGFDVIDERRRSSYSARNAGLAVSTAEVVAFTDADCVPDDDWVERGVAAMVDTGADLVAGHVEQRRSQSAASRHDGSYLDQADYVAQGFAATANLFVRRRVLNTLGGFDSALQSGGDYDLTTRAVEAGFRLVYAAGAVVEHEPRRTVSAVARKAYRIGRGHGQLARRKGDRVRVALAPERLVPARRFRRQPDLLAVECVVRVAAYSGRIRGYLWSPRPTQRERKSGRSR